MKTLYIMVGAPASGKSYFAKNKLMNGPGWAYVSRDEIRFSIIGEDEDYFAHEKEVFLEFARKICTMLNNESVYNVIADATHLNWGSRRKLLTAVEYYMGFGWKDIQIIPVVAWTGLKTIKKRNAERTGRACVPEDVLTRMWRNFTDPEGDPYHYTAVMYVTDEENEV